MCASKKTILEGHITNGKWRMSANKFYAADSIYTIHMYCMDWLCLNKLQRQTTGKSNSGGINIDSVEPSKSRIEQRTPNERIEFELNWIELWIELNGMEWNERMSVLWCIVSNLSDACLFSMPYMWQTLARNMKNVCTENFRLFAYEQWMAMTNRHVATIDSVRRCLQSLYFSSTKCFM